MSQIPPLSRRTELAFLYAALASDLATWKRLNPGKSEVLDAPPDPPIVWRIHEIAQRHRALLDDPTTDFAAPRAEMNTLLRNNQVRLGGTHTLDTEQMKPLMNLMLLTANAKLAPYENPPVISGW
jgi:hypothetical protein